MIDATYPDHIRVDVDERLIDLPWELAHDGTDFLCLRYALGRRILSENPVTVGTEAWMPTGKAMVIANPTRDLPSSEVEGKSVAQILRDNCKMDVSHLTGEEISRRDFLLALEEFDIVHFAGHAANSQDRGEPYLELSDGKLEASELAGFLRKRAPRIVFLNACSSADEGDASNLPTAMRGLGRTLMYAGVTAFLGYLVPVPDETARVFADGFYTALGQGHTIGEATRRARLSAKRAATPADLTWASAVLYGNPGETLAGSAQVH